MPDTGTQRGQSLVEMMISLVIAMMLSIVAMYLYSGQLRTFYHNARKQQTTEEVQAAFETITSLLREAEMCLSCATPQQIAISYPAGVANPNALKTPYLANDGISLDFTVPAGYAIWPNLTAPYANNAMHLSWSRLLSDYNPARGGFMLLGLVVMFAAPWLVSRWMNRKR